MTEDTAKGPPSETGEDEAEADAPGDGVASYRVLARKYRPLSFDALVGQDAMVRTLSNAMAAGRLAHAFILTGVRGIGKTTTARIIARALNCVGPDGKGGPTIDPCGVCEHCRAIIEDRHQDVIEMDAASRTGVEDIRDIIDGVRYRPVLARFKVYIVDEVHMLSRNAFNALLKTLEEPPDHVTFVFATTEIRKVPVTVLSRCQRFDLRRVAQDVLADYLGEIAGKEGVTLAPEALALVARAADGSVRDGLSLLDQAIAHSGTGEPIGAAAVREMMGLADRALILDLFERLMTGEIAAALALFDDMYRAGADPVIVFQDLLELVHWLTRLKIVPDTAGGGALAETERARAGAMAAQLAMPTLTRAWQMLLKGLGEVQQAEQPRMAAEMALVRLAYAADLPSPAALVGALTGEGEGDTRSAPTPTASSRPAAAPTPAPATPQAPSRTSSARTTSAQTASAPVSEAAPEPDPAPRSEDDAAPMPTSLEEVVALFETRGETLFAARLRAGVHVVRFAPGRIEFRPAEGAPGDLASRLGKELGALTGERWIVSVSGASGAPTIEEARQAAEQAQREEAAAHPLVRAALDLFPGSEIVAVRPIAPGHAAPDNEDTE